MVSPPRIRMVDGGRAGEMDAARSSRSRVAATADGSTATAWRSDGGSGANAPSPRLAAASGSRRLPVYEWPEDGARASSEDARLHGGATAGRPGRATRPWRRAGRVSLRRTDRDPGAGLRSERRGVVWKARLGRTPEAETQGARGSAVLPSRLERDAARGRRARATDREGPDLTAGAARARASVSAACCVPGRVGRDVGGRDARAGQARRPVGGGEHPDARPSRGQTARDRVQPRSAADGWRAGSRDPGGTTQVDTSAPVPPGGARRDVVAGIQARGRGSRQQAQIRDGAVKHM